MTFSKKELSSIDIIDEEIEDEILKVKNILSERILDTAKKNLNISKTTSATNPYKALEILTFSKNELASIDMTDNEIEEEVLNVKRILAKREKERKKKEEELILTCSLNVQKALTIENEKPEEALTLLQHAQKILEPYEARLDDVIEQGIDRCMNRLKERQERIKAKRAWEIERILQKHTSNVEEALRALRATHEKSEETLILLRNAQEDFESYQTDQNSDIIKLTRDIADGIKLVKWIQECERERKREEQDRVFRGLKFIACFILFYILLFIFVYIKTGTF